MNQIVYRKTNIVPGCHTLAWLTGLNLQRAFQHSRGIITLIKSFQFVKKSQKFIVDSNYGQFLEVNINIDENFAGFGLKIAGLNPIEYSSQNF